MLRDLDAGISGEAKGSLDWVVSGLGTGSLVVELESRTRVDDRNVGPEVTTSFVNGLSQLEDEGRTPEYLSDAGMVRAQRLVKLVGKGGISGLSVADPLREREIAITAKAAAHVDDLLLARRHAIGSVEGKLEMVSVHGRPRFIVYSSLTHKAVTCQFDRERLLGAVKDALGKRVNVAGKVYSNGRGEPLRVLVERIRVLKDASELPTIAEIRGIDPDFTGGLSTEDYVRSLRSG
jgi:hypothetical protein